MTEAAVDVAHEPGRQVVVLDRVLGVLFAACCAAYGLALAHPCDRAWRVVSGFAAVAVGGIWGAMASSLPPLAHAASGPSRWKPWDERRQRRASLVMYVVLAGIAVWAWTGTPAPPFGLPRLPRLPWRTIGLVALALLYLWGSSRSTAPASRLAPAGLVLGCLVFFTYAWDMPGVRDFAFVVLLWVLVGSTRQKPALLGIVLGVMWAAIANTKALELLEKLAACAP